MARQDIINLFTSQPAPIVLDCTLRDGGYYNDWDFDPSLVAKYINNAAAAGVKFFELGFRFTPKNSFLGAHAYTTDFYLDSLEFPNNIHIGVMVNAGDIFDFPGSQAEAIDTLISLQKNSRVEFVRIAVHFLDADKCYEMIRQLKKLGYAVGLNLMQAGGRSKQLLTSTANILAEWDMIDILYFADSLGNMNPIDVCQTITALMKTWKGPIGIHTHDNMGNALANSLAALEEGITYIDGTIRGMGRGAGNVATEDLLIELKNRKVTDLNPNEIFELAVDDFGELYDRYRWGSNIFYRLSGHNKVHPTYVQQMMLNDRYGTAEIVSAINALSRSGGESFSQQSMQSLISEGYSEQKGTWSAKDWAKNKTILLIASSLGSERHLKALITFIQKTKPIVISLNYPCILPVEIVDAYAICHPTRILAAEHVFGSIGKPLFIPLAVVPNKIKSKLNKETIFDYGIKVDSQKIEVWETGCTLTEPNSAAYSLCIAGASGAKQVLLAGLDGFEPGDERNVEMAKMFKLLKNAIPDLVIKSITPSSYSVEKSSVYLPHV